MSKQLGLMLVREKVINRNQLEEATSRCTPHGEDLIPQLLELGAVDDGVLSVFISEHLKIPLADRAILESIPSNALNMVARDLVQEFDMVPLGFEKGALKVAMVDPTHYANLAELQFFLGKKIIPLVASQNLIFEAMDRYYKLRKKPRKQTDPNASKTESQPIAPIENLKPVALPPKVVPQPEPVAHSEPVAPPDIAEAITQVPKPAAAAPPIPPLTPPDISQRVTIPAIPEQPPEPAPVAETQETMPPSPVEKTAPQKVAQAVDLASMHQRTLSLLDQANSKDQVVEYFLDFASKIMRRAAFFTIKKDVLLGWTGIGNHLDPRNLKGIMIPLNSPSIFQKVRDNKIYYLGEVPKSSVNQIFLTAIGGIHPPNVLLIPIVIRDRTVCVFYGDQESEELPSNHLHYLHLLVPKVALSFESLILKMKVQKAHK